MLSSSVRKDLRRSSSSSSFCWRWRRFFVLFFRSGVLPAAACSSVSSSWSVNLKAKMERGARYQRQRGQGGTETKEGEEERERGVKLCEKVEKLCLNVKGELIHHHRGRSLHLWAAHLNPAHCLSLSCSLSRCLTVSLVVLLLFSFPLIANNEMAAKTFSRSFSHLHL